MIEICLVLLTTYFEFHYINQNSAITTIDLYKHGKICYTSPQFCAAVWEFKRCFNGFSACVSQFMTAVQEEMQRS